MENQIEQQATEQLANNIAGAAPVEVNPEIKPIEYNPGELGEFPFEQLEGAMHSDDVAANYMGRGNALVKWLNGRNSVDAVTEILRAHGHQNPDNWKKDIHPDALLAETDEHVRLFLVKRALHMAFLEITTEDITNSLMVVNNKLDDQTWFAMFERQLVPVMIRLGV